MNQKSLNTIWSETLRKNVPGQEDLDGLAKSVLDLYHVGDTGFRQHVKNRFIRVTEATGQAFDADNFDIEMARAFIADELGFANWDDLIDRLRGTSSDKYQILFQYAIAALWRGDFTALENAVGGPERFDSQIKEWIDGGYFENEPEAMAESFAAACMLGHEKSVVALLDAGVNPYAGMRTGLAGFHYAASNGRLNIVKLLISRAIPMEVENMYGGTVFGQAIWSAIHENTPNHAAIVEALIEAGAVVDRGYLDWWREQEVRDPETARHIENALVREAESRARVNRANPHRDS